jgi:hypothetical protein
LLKREKKNLFQQVSNHFKGLFHRIETVHQDDDCDFCVFPDIKCPLFFLKKIKKKPWTSKIISYLCFPHATPFTGRMLHCGRHIVKKAFAELVFVLFEPGKFNKHKQKQSRSRCPAVKRGYLTACSLCRFFQGLKSGTAATDTPLFYGM